MTKGCRERKCSSDGGSVPLMEEVFLLGRKCFSDEESVPLMKEALL